jgi:NitT/TauT family transport system ATP-binding protein
LQPPIFSKKICLNTAIKIRGVSKIFATNDGPLVAFGPADLDIKQGEFVSLLGPSGCGKSTLLMMLAGLEKPSSGEIFLNHTPVISPRNDIGVMFQESTLVPWRSVRGNIELQLELRGEKPEKFRNQIDSLLNSVSLKSMEQRMPHELSGGMQQRAALCQALIHQPQTLLLDEPLGKLDAMTRENIRGDLQRLWLEKKPTVVMVTHSIEEAVQMSTRVFLISPRPGTINKVVDIEMDYPRNLAIKQDHRFINYIADIHSVFHSYGVI